MDEESADPISFRRGVVAGSLLLVLSRFLQRTMGFFSTIVLARLLFPEDFGLVAIASAFLAVISGMTQLSFNAALIRFQTDRREDFDTAWTLSVCRAFILSGIVLAGSFFVPQVIGDPRLHGIMLALSILPLIQGFTNPKFVVFQREMLWGREFFILTFSKFVGVVVTITAAIIFRSYWALILGSLASGMIRLPLSYILLPFLPRVSFASTRKFFSFSAWLMGSHFFNSIGSQTDKFVLGTLVGIDSTGKYFMGQEIAQMPTRELFAPILRTLFPGYMKIAGDKDVLREKALTSIGVLSAISVPAGVGFALISHEFVQLVLGTKWLSIVPMVEIITPVLGLQAMTNVAQGIALTKGSTRLLFSRALLHFMVHVPLMVAGATMYGFNGVVGAYILSEMFYLFLNLAILNHLLNCKWRTLLSRVWRSVASAAVMAFVVTSLPIAAPSLDMGIASLVAALAMKVIIGACVYACCHISLWSLSGRPDDIEPILLDAYFKVRQR